MDIKLYNGDCLEKIDEIPNNFINLIVTSPPYNVDLGNNKYNKTPYSLYNDNKEHTEYINWLKEIFRKVKSKLNPDGRLCINIGDGKNGAIPTSSDIIQFMCNELNYVLLAHIIWNKKQTSNRAAWGSFCSPKVPSYPSPIEHILIFANEEKKLNHDGETDITKEEFIKFAYGIWEFAPENKAKKIGHPAPFPEELPYRLIKMNSYVGDTVLDMFMGSGTTGVVCKNLNRNFIGIELDEKYFNIAKERINNTSIKKDD